MVSDFTDMQDEQKATKAELRDLERRVIVIESKVDTIDRKLDTILDWLSYFFKTVFGIVATVLIGAWLMNGGIG